jgi:tetratricopeptide (TPR) repeat protein
MHCSKPASRSFQRNNNPHLRPFTTTTIVCSQQRKGFGSGNSSSSSPKPTTTSPPQSPSTDEPSTQNTKIKKIKYKGKGFMRQGPSSAAARQITNPNTQQQQQQQQRPPSSSPLEPPSGGSLVDALEFETRLKLLKEEAEQRKKEQNLGQPVSVIDTGSVYDNPPPLSQTLSGGGGKSSSRTITITSGNTNQDSNSGGPFGTNQILAAGAAIGLGVVLLLTSADFGGGGRRKAVSTAGVGNGPEVNVSSSSSGGGGALSTERRAALENQLATFTTTLKDKEDDDASDSVVEALEGAAVTNAQLGNYKEAASQLQKLSKVKSKSQDLQVWRLLGDVETEMGDDAAAATAYEKAYSLFSSSSWSSKPDSPDLKLELLQGLTSALTANGKGQDAINILNKASSSSSSSAAAASSSSSSRPSFSKGLSNIEVGLLKAKVYSQWKGHVIDALATYDQLCDANPTDFRPFLAKAMLLKSQKSLGDAQRFYLQAKYLAPQSSRAIVDALFNQ